MNRYGRMAQQRWSEHQPEELAQLANPASYFTALGEEMATQIDMMAEQMAGEDPPQESYLEKVGRLQAARMRAEELVLSEMLPTIEEPTLDSSQESSQESDQEMTASQRPWTPLVVTADHPSFPEIHENYQNLNQPQ
ncbi:TnpV protein [Nonomuraea soli]|uniref:TnpV protein n=1 Tax=Nonomuraea soli TaxID=1032476 RepID=A0A7W0CUU6_9ACTN|nr:TnpV protein [Nonomuraea soli]MBA2897726.1 hypothetical protein [Nonomuraea soli]